MRKIYILLSIPLLLTLSGCIVPLHLFLTNLTNKVIVVNYQIKISWDNNGGHTNPFRKAPQVISNNIKASNNDLYYANVEEINDNLNDSLKHINLEDFEFKKSDTILNVSISLKPKETIYFGCTTHFADIYGMFIDSKMVIKSNDTIVMDTKTIAELFDRENRFKVNRFLLFFGDQAKNLVLWDRAR